MSLSEKNAQTLDIEQKIVCYSLDISNDSKCCLNGNTNEFIYSNYDDIWIRDKYQNYSESKHKRVVLLI